jgi:ATP-binding cassette subfamily B protein
MLDYKKFDASAEEQSLRIQIVQSMPSIKLHGIENSMKRKWEVIQSRLFVLSMKSLGLNQWQQTGAMFITETKNIVITFISAKAVVDGNISLGTMLAIQYIVGQLNSPIEQMIGFIQSFQNAKISMERLNEVHGIEDEEPKHKTFFASLPASFSMQLTGGRGVPVPGFPFSKFPTALRNHFSRHSGRLSEITEPAIHIRNLNFTYTGAGNEAVLHNLDFSIPKGKTTAIVGMSGSGKTTLLKLLLKFYDPSRGDITIDDLSLGKISHRFWRSCCGVVLQDSYLFATTIAKNISLGDDTVDYEKLYHAVSVANAKDFIEQLPMSYNTKIGPDGHGLSMGQRQRILIARAVYADPEFLFFDEATNSLDANNEKIILNNLQSFFSNRTVIVVAHRLSTVKNADQIVVLNNGRIIEKGNHNDLVQLRGEYFTLVKNQLELGD